MAKFSWLMQSLIAMALLAPIWISVTFFSRNFSVRGDVYLLWYMTGVVLGTIGSFIWRAVPFKLILPSFAIVAAIFVIGLLFGALTNVLLFQAVSQAPNPGLPVAISTAANVLVFFGAAGLALVFPAYFGRIVFSGQHLLGILLTVSGVVLIILKK